MQGRDVSSHHPTHNCGDAVQRHQRSRPPRHCSSSDRRKHPRLQGRQLSRRLSTFRRGNALQRPPRGRDAPQRRRQEGSMDIWRTSTTHRSDHPGLQRCGFPGYLPTIHSRVDVQRCCRPGWQGEGVELVCRNVYDKDGNEIIPMQISAQRVSTLLTSLHSAAHTSEGPDSSLPFRQSPLADAPALSHCREARNTHQPLHIPLCP